MKPDNAHLLWLLMFRLWWVVMIVIHLLNGVIWWRRGQSKIADDPSLAPGYRRLIRYWCVYGSLPWLVMGAGIFFGGVPTIVHYFNLSNGPFVFAFWLTTIAEWIATTFWMFFRGGAEDMIAHPGLLNLPTQRLWVVKAYYLLALTGGVIAMLAMLFLDLPSPNFR